ncbi:hypothetical protein AB4F11_08980 [Francisella philomiragia]
MNIDKLMIVLGGAFLSISLLNAITLEITKSTGNIPGNIVPGVPRYDSDSRSDATATQSSASGSSDDTGSSTKTLIESNSVMCGEANDCYAYGDDLVISSNNGFEQYFYSSDIANFDPYAGGELSGPPTMISTNDTSRFDITVNGGNGASIKLGSLTEYEEAVSNGSLSLQDVEALSELAKAYNDTQGGCPGVNGDDSYGNAWWCDL